MIRKNKEAIRKAHWAKRQEFKTYGLGIVSQAEPDVVTQFPATSRLRFKDLRHGDKRLQAL